MEELRAWFPLSVESLLGTTSLRKEVSHDALVVLDRFKFQVEKVLKRE